MTEEKEKKRKFGDKYLYQRLSRYIFNSKITLAAVLCIITLDVFIQLGLPLIIAEVLDLTVESSDFRLFTWLMLAYAGLFLISRVDQFLGIYGLGIIGENAVYALRKDTFESLQYLSQDYYDDTPTGDTISRLTNDLDSMNPLLSGQVLYALLSLVTFIGTLVIMFSINWILTLMALISVPLFIPLSYVQKNILRPKWKTVRESISKVSASMTENIMGAKVSTAFARADLNQSEFGEVNDGLAEDFYDFIKKNAYANGVYEVFGSLMRALILLAGAMLVYYNQESGITVGVLMIFLLYIGNMLQPLHILSSLFGQLQSALASFERIILLIDEEPSVKESDDAFDLVITDGAIEMKNVTFKYNTSESNVIEAFNLSIHPMEKLAIVGATGSGKTTLSNLISRLYEIQDGEISIDGQNIQDVTLQSLRGSVGVVLQDPVLVKESIRYNLCYGKDVSDDELEKILKLVGAEFVFDLPEGLDTIVGERGTRFSLGQRQLLSFARALVPDPKILLLDEATSSIDPQAELRIQKAMSTMLKNRTSIIIAHRLSTVKQADRVIVLDKGKIIEEGSFSELLQQKGEFYQLYKLQIGNGNGRKTAEKQVLLNPNPELH
ncbi:MAG: ABC transporter ATP-binding protein [Candidatus Heimdallarchaeota archaeon]|nr:ABC transporter ATP-binding protein [Candidatus Heimdallarchaeota archaeon]